MFKVSWRGELKYQFYLNKFISADFLCLSVTIHILGWVHYSNHLGRPLWALGFWGLWDNAPTLRKCFRIKNTQLHESSEVLELGQIMPAEREELLWWNEENKLFDL